MGPGEFPAEFVNIDGFKIFRLFLVGEFASGNELPDVVVFIQRDDRAVHPAFKFGDEGKAGIGVAEQGVNNGVFKNQVFSFYPCNIPLTYSYRNFYFDGGCSIRLSPI